MPAERGAERGRRRTLARLVTRHAVALVLVAASLVAAGCRGGDDGRTESASTGADTAAPLQVAGCPVVQLAWVTRPSLVELVPPSRAGLWLRQDGCVYVVRAAKAEANPLWRAPRGQEVHGLNWAPDGRSFAVAVGSRVLILRRNGSLVEGIAATGAVFLRDGRLVLSRADGIYLGTGTGGRQLASRAELEQVAGFRPRLLTVSNDPRGFTRGHGNGFVALTLWGAGRSFKSVVLVVSTSGRVARASPAYQSGAGAVSGWAWSPAGNQLFITAEVAGPAERRQSGRHDHCLDIWGAQTGVRRGFCESELPSAHHLHFAKLLWSTDQRTALLDTGTVFTADGNVVGRVSVRADDLRIRVQWEPKLG